MFFQSIVITEPQPIDDNEIITSAACLGNCNGVIALNPTGGNAGAYTYSWSVRPQEIEQYYNNPPSNKTTPVDKKTEPVNKVKPTPVDNTPVSDDNKNYDTLKINTSDLTSFIQEVRTKTQGLTVSLYSLKADITPDNCSFEILHAKPGAKDIQSTLKKIKRFTVALSTQNEGEAAADNILSKNPESKVIRKGTFDNGRTWKLIAVM